MKKYLFYALRDEKMCFIHVLLNALDLHGAGNTVKLVFEGKAVTFPPLFAKEGNPLYKKVLEAGLIAGVCEACSKALGVYDDVAALGLPFLNDMSGHAGMKPFTSEGFKIITM